MGLIATSPSKACQQYECSAHHSARIADCRRVIWDVNSLSTFAATQFAIGQDWCRDCWTTLRAPADGPFIRSSSNGFLMAWCHARCPNVIVHKREELCGTYEHIGCGSRDNGVRSISIVRVSPAVFVMRTQLSRGSSQEVCGRDRANNTVVKILPRIDLAYSLW